MCGILCLFGGEASVEELRQLALVNAKLLRHRGPDWSGVWTHDGSASGADGAAGPIPTAKAVLAHERLAIVDPESGAQPLLNGDGSVALAVNGEIYNHEALRGEFADSYSFKTKSDCEVILPLYEKYGPTPELVKKLDGMFFFALYDKKKDIFFAARDHQGIVPGYIGWRADGCTVVSSELKALQEITTRFEVFEPGCCYSSVDAATVRWYAPMWRDINSIPTQPLALVELRQKFEAAVVKRMMSDVPWGVLLSGGLDSSLVASIASRHASKSDKWPRLHSFSIGLEGSPDLAAAQKVATFLDTVHHNMVFTVQEGLDAVRDVVFNLETYDVTTIRAATPMYLMARKIKALGIKMVLSGEGADEALGGYLYFHKAPNKGEFHAETLDKLAMLDRFDCLRANKAMSAFGVEPRVPFLDQDFLEYAMTLDPEHKMCVARDGRPAIEKWVLRKAFDTPESPYLPESVLWRQKEQFSDGVGYSWIDSLRQVAEDEVTALMFKNRAHRFPKNTPMSKEGYRDREIFESFFPSESARDTVPQFKSIACSTERALSWSKEFADIGNAVGGDNSGRTVSGVHNSAYDDTAAIVAGGAASNGADAKPAPAKKQKTVA